MLASDWTMSMICLFVGGEDIRSEFSEEVKAHLIVFLSGGVQSAPFTSCYLFHHKHPQQLPNQECPNEEKWSSLHLLSDEKISSSLHPILRGQVVDATGPGERPRTPSL